MIKIFLIILVSFFSNSIINLNEKIVDVNLKLDHFFNLVKSDSMTYNINEEVYVIFDYQNVEIIKDSLFENALIEKENESSFIIIVEIEEACFKEQIKRKIYVKRGDLYA